MKTLKFYVFHEHNGNAGCDKVTNNVYCCWILGIIPPTMGTLEKPVSVFTLGFNSAFIPMSPQTIGQQDMMRMHYYTRRSSPSRFL